MINVNFFKSLKFLSFVSTIMLLPIPAVHAEKITEINPVIALKI